MARHSLFWPLSFVVCFGVMIIASLFSVVGNPDGYALAQNVCVETTPETAYRLCQTQTVAAKTAAAAQDTSEAQLTGTAAELTEVALANPCRRGQSGYPICATQTAAQVLTNTARPPAANTDVPPTAPAQQNTPTSTNTIAATRTVTRTATLAPTRAPSATVDSGATAITTVTDAIVDAAPATPTPAIQSAPCAPGDLFSVVGEAPANTALIVSFNAQTTEGTPTPISERTVAGGRSDSNGLYRIVLLIGDERPGFYEVQVRVRATRELLDTQLCTVPETTPTVTPRLGR